MNYCTVTESYLGPAAPRNAAELQPVGLVPFQSPTPSAQRGPTVGLGHAAASGHGQGQPAVKSFSN